MPLIKCPECNKEISDQAAACPSCGHPVKPVKSEPTVVITKKGNTGLKVLGFFIIVIGLIWGMAVEGSYFGWFLFFGGFVVFIAARFKD